MNKNNNQTTTNFPDSTTKLKDKPLNPEALTFIPTASTNFKEGDDTSPHQKTQPINQGIAEDQPGNQVDTGALSRQHIKQSSTLHRPTETEQSTLPRTPETTRIDRPTLVNPNPTQTQPEDPENSDETFPLNHIKQHIQRDPETNVSFLPLHTTVPLKKKKKMLFIPLDFEELTLDALVDSGA